MPDAPDQVVLTGADGRQHSMRYRIWRAPTGNTVELLENSVPQDGGYQFGVLGDHDADVASLTTAVRAQAEDEIGRCHLQPRPDGVGWQLAAEQVAGRLEWNPDGGPHGVIVDGRSLSWHELGQSRSKAAGFGW